MPSRLTQREYIAILAVTSAVVLALGVLLKPKQLPKATITGEETLRLQTLTQRRNLEDLAVYFSEVAGGIQPGVVWLNELAVTGLVWNAEGLIVTAGPNQMARPDMTALTTSGNVTLDAQILSKHFRAASLKAPQDVKLQPVRKGSTQGLTPGIWIIEVARQAGGHYLFTPGVYAGIASARCGNSEYQTVQSNLPLTESALGGGLFDVDGNLLAVVLRCDDHFAAVLPNVVDRELARATSFEGKLLRSYGLQVTALDEVARKYFQVKEGVLVSEVTDGQMADEAGLMPGDVITASDRAPVGAPADVRPLIEPSDQPTFQLDILRSRRPMRIELRSGGPKKPEERQGADYRGVSLTDLPQGYLVGAVLPGSRAERASIRAGDRLLQVDGTQPKDLAAVRKALSDDKGDPIFVLLHRGSRKIGTFLN